MISTLQLRKWKPRDAQTQAHLVTLQPRPSRSWSGNKNSPLGLVLLQKKRQQGRVTLQKESDLCDMSFQLFREA